jgi:hypothetical protein
LRSGLHNSDCNSWISDKYPGQEVPGRSGEKTPEIDGTWNQYSRRKFFGLFPMIFGRVLPKSTKGWQESTGKFPAELLLP